MIGAVESTERALNVMAASGRCPVAVLTLPRDKMHRHSDYVDLRPRCAALGIELREAARVDNPETISWLRKLSPDVLFVIGWSEILSARILNLPGRGCIGFHPSPLPRMRGRGVIPWQILSQVQETAGTLLLLDEGVDSGDIVAQRHFSVPFNADSRRLYDLHMENLERMLAQSMEQLDTDGSWASAPQDGKVATYCSQRLPIDGLIDWHKASDEVERLVRASTRPYPGAYSRLRGKGQTVRIWAAKALNLPVFGIPGQVVKHQDGTCVVQCGDGQLELLKISGERGGDAISLPIQARFLDYSTIRCLEASKA